MIGASLDRLALCLVRDETYAAIVAPAIADLQHEALFGRWLVLRGYAGVWRALLAAFAGELRRDVLTLLRRGPITTAVGVALFTDIALTVAYIAPIILGSAWRPAQAPWHHTAILMMLSFPMWVGWAVPTAVAASATVLASSRERGATRAAVLIAVGIGILLLVGASALDSSSHDLRRDFAFASGFARKNPELYKRPLWELRSVFRTRLDAINEQDRKARLRFERPHTGIQLREHGHQVGTTALTLIACALLGAAWARRRFPQIAAIVAGVLALQFIFAFATLYSTPIYGRIVVAWSQAVLLFLTSLLLFGRMSKRVLRFGL